MDVTNTTLLDGILNESEVKAREISAQCDAQCEKILSEARLEGERKAADERKAGETKLTQLKFRYDANRNSLERRAVLKRVEDNYRAVMEEVDAQFTRLAQSAEFRPYLVKWVAEAAIGLDLKEAKVAYNRICPVDRALLDEAEALVKRVTGTDVHLVLDDRPISKIGVVLTGMDNKVSFNNQIDVRMRRFDRQIRTMIQEERWTE